MCACCLLALQAALKKVASGVGDGKLVVTMCGGYRRNVAETAALTVIITHPSHVA